ESGEPHAVEINLSLGGWREIDFGRQIQWTRPFEDFERCRRLRARNLSFGYDAQTARWRDAEIARALRGASAEDRQTVNRRGEVGEVDSHNASGFEPGRRHRSSLPQFRPCRRFE